jgi:uncharacterized lipoprotein YehR (DUF1307 family)
MKNATKLEAIRSIAGIIVIAIIALAIIGCKEDEPEPQPVPQSKTISGIQTNDNTTTVNVTVYYTGTRPGVRHQYLLDGAR